MSSRRLLVVLSTQYRKKFLLFSCFEQLANRPAEHSIADVSLTARRLGFVDGEVLLVEETLWILYYLSGATFCRSVKSDQNLHTEVSPYLNFAILSQIPLL